MRGAGASRKGKSSTSPRCKRLHAQDHAGQAGTQDLRLGIGRALVEILLVVELEADASRDPAAAPGALAGRRARDRLDLQLLDLVAMRVALDARQTRSRSHSGCRARSARSRRHWSPAPRGDPGARKRHGACSTAVWRANSGSTSRPGGWCLRSASAASRISRSPGRNTSTSPGPVRCASSTASTMASLRSVSFFSSKGRIARLDRIQPARKPRSPGAPSKCLLKRSASSVAEVTITFRSRRFGSTA
jgi:hypothetical protein